MLLSNSTLHFFWGRLDKAIWLTLPWKIILWVELPKKKLWEAYYKTRQNTNRKIQKLKHYLLIPMRITFLYNKFTFLPSLFFTFSFEERFFFLNEAVFLGNTFLAVVEVHSCSCTACLVLNFGLLFYLVVSLFKLILLSSAPPQ